MQYILLFCIDLLHWLTGSILVKKMLPHSTGQKITRHNYVLSVQDWCYNTATLTVTVTENIVSMDQGKYWGSRRSLINIRPKLMITFMNTSINKPTKPIVTHILCCINPGSMFCFFFKLWFVPRKYSLRSILSLWGKSWRLVSLLLWLFPLCKNEIYIVSQSQLAS
jgi:hypothetical protein